MEIIEKDKNYSSACSKFFSCKHHWSPPLAQNIYHPNQYYIESRKALKMSVLTPPDSGQQPMDSELQTNDMSLTADTTAGTFDDSVFDMTDEEFDRSLAGIQFDIEPKPTIVSNESPESDPSNNLL